MNGYTICNIVRLVTATRTIRCLSMNSSNDSKTRPIFILHNRKTKTTEECCYNQKEMKWEKITSKSSVESQASSISQNMLTYLLPAHYPKSVQEGYIYYSFFGFLANIASTTNMVLSTQQLLFAVGVGTPHVAPISATLNWILKDGFGQLGGIVFASKISRQNVTSIDNDPKRWRMISSLSMDSACMLDMIAPLFPSSFLLVASIANIGKNISFLTAGASRAKLHQELSMQDNLGDVTAKATSQGILASLLGTGIGIYISPILLHDFDLLMTVCLGLASLNQILTYASLKQVVFKKLNHHRLNLLLDIYFDQRLQDGSIDIYRNNCPLDPKNISKRENVLPFDLTSHNNKSWLILGGEFDEMFPHGHHDVKALMKRDENYILNCSIKTNGDLDRIYVLFFTKATPRDIIRANFHAFFLRDEIRFHLKTSLSSQNNYQFIQTSYAQMENVFNDFLLQLQTCGWDIDGEQLSVEDQVVMDKTNLEEVLSILARNER